MAPITIARDGDLLRLTLNRPAQRNAMSDALVAALIEAFSKAETDECRAIVLAGEGDGFCAGSDLTGLAGMDDAGRHAFELESGRLARLIASCPRPVVALVHGFAMGGGLTLAAACDLVVTTPGAKWSLPEVPVGLFPAWGIESVVDRVGKTGARRLCWGMDVWNGHEATAFGLADFVADDVVAMGTAVASKLAALPPTQAAAVKDYFTMNSIAEAADDRAAALFSQMTGTNEAIATFERFGKPR